MPIIEPPIPHRPEKDIFKIPIENKSKVFDALNLKVEVAIVKGDKTYHLRPDRSDFIILPRRRNEKKDSNERYIRKYHASKFEHYTMEILEIKADPNVLDFFKNDSFTLRVRVHATHGFTGFGRGFEECFNYSKLKLID